ncbi:MAG: hypothetical protein JWO07_112 [Candidatus Saccharibacteria bacterium]|nr:hypothetical protein [Candidatus Saccharibacteria bacterium]
MTTPEGPRTPEQPYDDAEDRLSNQAGSYADGHFWEGTAEPIKPGKTWEEIEADKEGVPKKKVSSRTRSKIAKAATGPQYGDEAGVGYPGGKPPEHQNFPAISAEQAALNHEASQNWRARGEQAIRDGTHAVDDDE